MIQDFIAGMHKATPLCDRIYAILGAATAGALTLGHLQAGVGIAVGIATLLVMIPRAIIGWLDARDRIRKSLLKTQDLPEK
jgi:hypothetical protein